MEIYVKNAMKALTKYKILFGRLKVSIYNFSFGKLKSSSPLNFTTKSLIKGVVYIRVQIPCLPSIGGKFNENKFK